MNFDFLKASDGSGDAALMHVTDDRLAGSATLKVDTLVNVPTKFIGTWGTLLSSGLIDPTTKRDFRGHTSGADIIIDAMEAGNTDDGNVEGQIVVIKPNTGWSNRVAEFIMNLTNTNYPVNTPPDIFVGDLTAGDITADSVTINGAVLLNGETNATFRHEVTGPEISASSFTITFAHGLAYTPKVEARWHSEASVATTWFNMPFDFINPGDNYYGIPTSLAVKVQSVDATNITVAVAASDLNGSSLLSANYKMRFQFYCTPFPGL